MLALREHQHPRLSFDKADMGTLLSIVERFAPRLTMKLLDVLLSVKTQTALKKIAAAIEKGDVNLALSYLDLQPPEFVPAKEVLRQVVTLGAAYAATKMPPLKALTGNKVTFRFDLLNPSTVQSLQAYEFGLIRQINAATKDGIRQVLVSGMQRGLNPRQVATEVKDLVGLTKTQAQAVLNFRKELETFHLRSTGGAYNLGGSISRAPGGAQVFAIGPDGKPLDGILARRLRDFRYDRTLLRAIEQGKPLSQAQIDKMVEAYASKYAKYRAQTIARTEAMRAANLGAYEQWRQAVDAGMFPEGLVRRKWLVATDERTCPTCMPIPGMNPKLGVPLEQPFKTPAGDVFMPPLHPSCRCTVFHRVYEPDQLLEEFA